MKNLIALASAILISVLALGQNFGEIHGKVVDEYGEPLPGLNVYTQSSSGELMATTNMEGKYKLKPLNPGIYILEFSFMGYDTQRLTDINVDPDKISTLKKVQMGLSATDIPEVVIYTYVDKLIDPEETSRITMRASDIKSNARRTSPLDMIASMKSDIKKDTDGELYFRGSRPGAVQYNIDGVKMTADAARIPSSAIGSISVYTGGLPAKYGDTTGGVVVIETKSYMDLYNSANR